MWTSLYLRITQISRYSRIRSRTAINRNAHRSQRPTTVIIICGQVEETDQNYGRTFETYRSDAEK